MENEQDTIMVRGGTPLHGRVTISGAKNSAVALLPAAILANSPVVIDNIPDISDVYVLMKILNDLGAKVEFNKNRITINPKNIRYKPLESSDMKALRASYYFMGAMLGRFKKALVSLPGGDNIGPRPIDQHIKGFTSLGANVEYKHGAISLTSERLVGNKIFLDIVSVGATINIMLAASTSEGVTIIENAAKEPEIVDVATLLNAMGTKIKGAGTDVIRIEGNKNLTGCEHTIIPDRIEAGTYMIAAAATHGDVYVDNIIPKHLEPLIAKLKELGADVEEFADSVRVNGVNKNYQGVDIKTAVYPGFPTDLQQPFTVLLLQSNGTSLLTENIHTARFKHIDELRRMGAKIRLEGKSAIIEGISTLVGTKVKASDLRAGASLVIAGLVANEITEITNIIHIDRGYENLTEKLSNLGATIWRVKSPHFIIE